MATFSESIKEFINVNGLAAKIKALETELGLLKTLQSTVGGKKRGRKPGKLAKAAPKAKKGKRAKRGSVGKAIRAFLATRGKAGAKVQEIAAATGSKPANVTSFFYAKGNQKEFKKVAPATFALTGKGE